MKRIQTILFLLIGSVLINSGTADAQDMKEQFEKNVTEFTLDNGLKFIVIERHTAPVASFFTYADVGSVDEVKGITGMAHMFEHMAFKGTTTIGTLDIAKEQAALERVDELVLQIQAARSQRADSSLIADLQARLATASSEAQAFVNDGEFDQVIDRNGGVNLNASTSWDATSYYYSLPSNKVELWFSLESDRFLNPVLREFYTERGVVAEERRMRTESSAFGRLFEEFLTTAFKAHPYGEPVVGHMADIQAYTRPRAEEFFRTYYNAANLTIAIAGDVDPKEIRKLAQTYFGRLSQGAKPNRVVTKEPDQIAERRVIMEDPSQPLILIGWHKGGANHPDDPAFEVLADVLSAGRTSRFYKQLVEGKQVALQADAYNSLNGFNKYPNLFFLFGVPGQGVSAEDLEKEFYLIIEDVIDNGVSDAELRRSKTRARANLVRGLQSNNGIASKLAYYEVVTGTWKNLFNRLERLQGVTSEDLQRVARETLTSNNRTVAYIKTIAPTTAQN